MEIIAVLDHISIRHMERQGFQGRYFSDRFPVRRLLDSIKLFDDVGVNRFRVVFQRSAVSASAPDVTPDVTPDVRLVTLYTSERSRQGLQRALQLRDEEHFRKAYLLVALEQGLVEMTIPDRPRSRLQRYRLTAAGKALVATIRQS